VAACTDDFLHSFSNSMFKFFEFVIHDHVAHYFFFADYIKICCVVMLLDDCIQIQSDIDSIQG
jgi:hypothetical protein